MTLESIDQNKQNQSTLVLANASALVCGVIREIAGNDISTSINDGKATAEIVTSLACQRILKRLEQKSV